MSRRATTLASGIASRPLPRAMMQARTVKSGQSLTLCTQQRAKRADERVVGQFPRTYSAQ